MTYHPGAVRSIAFPRDKFAETDPLNRPPVAATAEAWRSMVDLAANGHPLAQCIVDFGRAKNAEKLAAVAGTDLPEWAADILNSLNYDDQSEALAALSAIA